MPNKIVFNWASKSILYQEQPSLLELASYIHLNLIRAKIVSDMKALDKFPLQVTERSWKTANLTGKTVSPALGIRGLWQ